MSKPQWPADRHLEGELGRVDQYFGASFPGRNTMLANAAVENYFRLSSALADGRQNEMSGNAAWLRQNVPGLRRTGKAIQRLADRYTRPTALSRDVVAGGHAALENPMAGNAALQNLNSDSSLLTTMNRQAADELALNGRLSEEGARAAEQQARAAYAARGLGTSGAAALSEVLNREAYQQQRQDRARAFATSVTGQNMALSDLTQGAIDSGRRFALGANEQDMARRQAALGAKTAAQQFRLQASPGMMAYSTASMAPVALSEAIGTARQADVYPQQLAYASDIFNTNYNAAASRYNSYLNNQAAMQGANLQANAAASAGDSAMFGSIASGAGAAIGGAAMAVCWIARAAYRDDRWKAFRHALLRHASDRFLRFHCRCGPGIGAWIESRPWARAITRAWLGGLLRKWT